ncbi:MAG: VWA domain-containing protein [Longimicrobiales bacterium]
MTLARPEWLPLLPLALVAVLGALVIQWKRRRRLGRALPTTALARLLPVGVDRFPTVRAACLVVATAAVSLAATGVVQRAPEQPPPPTPLDLAIAVDVSASMGARDTEPSRIGRAQEVVSDLAASLPGARIVLVVFADWPYTLVPPTDDARVVTYFADALQADLVLDRDQGTALAAVLRHAGEALAARPREGARRAILVLSDGGAHDDAADVLAAAAEAAAGGTEVWTAGLGNERGAELETATGPLLDAAGAPVVTRLEDELLIRVAAAGGGRYERVVDDRGVRSLASGLERAADAAPPEHTAVVDVTLLLILLALPLILLEGALDSGRGLPHRRPSEGRA